MVDTQYGWHWPLHLWDNCEIGLKDRLQKYQNRAAKVISGETYDIRSSGLYFEWPHCTQS